MEKTALEMISELNSKFTIWEKLIKDKRFELKTDLKKNKEYLQDTEASLGYQLGEGNADKVKMLKQRKKTYQAEINDIEDSLQALDQASGHTNFINDFENIWKTSLSEYTEVQKEYLSKDGELEELEAQLNELQRKVVAIRKQRTDLSYDIHSFSPVIRFAQVIDRIYKPADRINIVEKQLYSKLHDKYKFPENWQLATLKESQAALTEVLHDLYGKAASNEINGKSINWKRG